MSIEDEMRELREGVEAFHKNLFTLTMESHNEILRLRDESSYLMGLTRGMMSRLDDLEQRVRQLEIKP